LYTTQQHHDPVNPRSHAAVWRRSILEGTIEPAETLLHILARKPHLLKGRHHGFGLLVTDRSRSDFETVTDRVVLIGIDRQRVLALERFAPTLRHRERVVPEVETLFLLVPLVEREIHDPAPLETVEVKQLEV